MKILLSALFLVAAIGCQPADEHDAKSDAAATRPDVQLADDVMLDEYLAQYAPYEMFFDASGLPEEEKALLRKLVDASGLISDAYLLQTSKAAIDIRTELDNQPGPSAEKALTLLRRNGMPYDQLKDHATFAGGEPYYGGHEIYPRGMTAETFDRYFAKLDEEHQAAFMDPYTVIREDEHGGYYAVPYHVEYAEQIAEIAALLREAAGLATNTSFRDYLRLKADALESDDYFDVDVAWVELTGNPYELVIGPFETYSDGIKGVKAKYESFVEIVDQEESKKLEVYKKYLPALEDNLPIPDEYKSNVEGLTAKFVIVQDIHRGGEAGVGYQAVAANLPNDPKVHAEKGTVKTFWKNMFKARFDTIIRPVSQRLIAEDQQQYLSADGFFQFVVMHEICHALGPRTVKVGPKKGQAANAAIGPVYSPLEEGKADIAGMLSLVWLMDNGVVDANREREFYVSYLGSLFRSVRFGTQQAHGKAAALSINYLTNQGAIAYDADTQRWSIVFDKFRDGVRNLAGELLLLLGNGEGDAVMAFFDQWGMTPELQAGLDSITDLPIDVLPEYKIQWD
ncbi:MAG: hypothetical protein OER80_14555 [Gammaproteobacteria bacterium]|nr:hypothetical protein [Gammaproteobacteria bacterium]MDH3767504.1 hypothetical protein [Gammaproteobacteria bacterium]